MTTSHEPPASAHAAGGSGETRETPKEVTSAGPGATMDKAAPADGAMQITPDAVSTGTVVEHADAAANGDAPGPPEGAIDGSSVDEDAGELDDYAYDEFDDDFGDEAATGWPSLFRWRPSQRTILVAGAVILAVALFLPLTFAAFGARGVGPLAARPTPTITPTATATPPQQVTLQDPLTKRSSRWQEQQDCSMHEDGYHIAANSICFLAGAPIRDSYITVTVEQLAGVDDLSYGVTLRRVDKGDYYSFEIDGSGKWYFYKAAVDSNGAPVLTLLASHADNPSIHRGLHQSNTLQVRATGQHFEFFVNDVKVGQVNDSSYAQGIIGLGGNDQLEVVYSNFILTQPA
jgi:hypothetical protein